MTASQFKAKHLKTNEPKEATQELKQVPFPRPMPNLEDTARDLLVCLYAERTLRELSEFTGIQITRIHRILSHKKELSFSEVSKILECAGFVITIKLKGNN